MIEFLNMSSLPVMRCNTYRRPFIVRLQTGSCVILYHSLCVVLDHDVARVCVRHRSQCLNLSVSQIHVGQIARICTCEAKVVVTWLVSDYLKEVSECSIWQTLPSVYITKYYIHERKDSGLVGYIEVCLFRVVEPRRTQSKMVAFTNEPRMNMAIK
jgi:hypothetical protein